MSEQHLDAEIASLLERLNRWVHDSGVAPGDPGGDVRSSGESNAAVESLLARLRGLGADVRWDEPSGRYAVVTPGTGAGTAG